MINKSKKIGILFGILSIFLGGIQPIIANLRPSILDSHIFSGMSSLFQGIFFIPIYLLERYLSKRNSGNFKANSEPFQDSGLKLYFGTKKLVLFLIVGILFSVILFLYYSGLSLAGAINGTLAHKSSVFFGLLFGFLLLKEKVTKIQILFSFTLFVGMMIAITQCNFSLLEINMGVIMILICSAIWMAGHTCSRPYLQKKITSSSELLVARSFISASILIITYIIFYGDAILIIFNPINAFYYLLMALVYGFNLFSWYQIIKYLDISLGSIIISPQIIVAAFLGAFFLGEPFTIYHLIGLIMMLVSIIVINYQKK